MLQLLTPIYRVVVHFLYPQRCTCCRLDLSYKNTSPLCGACADKLKQPGPLICRRCGRVLSSGGAYCFACRGSKADKYKCKIIRSAFIFNEPVRRLVHALKYRQNVALAKYMGGQMASFFPRISELKNVNYVVPVPLFARRLRQRGFNQSELLARVVAEKLNLPLDTVSLIRTRDTGSQTKLGREARERNMQGAFKCVAPEKVKGKIILLIDDVCTTGATLESCAVALRNAGARRVVALTYARE